MIPEPERVIKILVINPVLEPGSSGSIGVRVRKEEGMDGKLFCVSVVGFRGAIGPRSRVGEGANPEVVPLPNIVWDKSMILKVDSPVGPSSNPNQS